MKKWLRITAAVLGGLIASVFIIGVLLPREHVASRTAELSVPAESVWVAITDIEAFPRWRPEVSRVEQLPMHDGHAVWREHADYGPMTLEAIEQVPPRRLVTRIVDQDLGYGGEWTYEIVPTERGSRITITENGYVDSPLFRFMSRFVFGQTSTMETHLRALGGRFGETVEPMEPMEPAAPVAITSIP